MLWFTSVIFSIILQTNLSSATSELQERFYNELRNLLNNRILPIDSNTPRPTEVTGWGSELEGVLGQISGVSVTPNGLPVVFHRGPRKWDDKSFNSSNHYQLIQDGPIKVNTVVILNPDNGKVLTSWGSNMFYLPHGITVDHHGNTWLTDVAMHQVMKFPERWSKPSLRLGELFRPGHGRTQFCKPTSVAVATTGEFFVADGYCNRRILKFSHQGQVLRIFPHHGEFLSLVVPHSISLLEKKDLLCVADRENMRVVCFKAELGQSNMFFSKRFSPLTIHQPDFGRVYGIAAYKGDIVFAINGPTSSHIPLQGFTLNPFTETVIDHWAPKRKEFTSPHAIAVSPLGDALYVSEIGPNKLWKFSLD